MATQHMTPVTYMATPLQQQFLDNQELVAGKPYADVFTGDLEVPAERARALQNGPLAPEWQQTPSLADIDRFITNYRDFPDVGYALLDGPTAYTQSRMLMPGVTAEMLRWWYTWHPLEAARYTLWFPFAHVENVPADPARLADASRSYEERLYNNVNTATEFIGSQALQMQIHFVNPVELGARQESLDRAGLTFSVSGTLCPAFAPDTTFGLMLHLGRDTAEGFEFVSRYWIGAHPEMRRFKGAEHAPALLETMGLGPDQLRELAYDLSVHDMTEYHILARILPDLYKRFA